MSSSKLSNFLFFFVFGGGWIKLIIKEGGWFAVGLGCCLVLLCLALLILALPYSRYGRIRGKGHERRIYTTVLGTLGVLLSVT